LTKFMFAYFEINFSFTEKKLCFYVWCWCNLYVNYVETSVHGGETTESGPVQYGLGVGG
jgi:hypothetical protein